jgi:hypothetical protein
LCRSSSSQRSLPRKYFLNGTTSNNSCQHEKIHLFSLAPTRLVPPISHSSNAHICFHIMSAHPATPDHPAVQTPPGHLLCAFDSDGTPPLPYEGPNAWEAKSGRKSGKVTAVEIELPFLPIPQSRHKTGTSGQQYDPTSASKDKLRSFVESHLSKLSPEIREKSLPFIGPVKLEVTFTFEDNRSPVTRAK